MILAVNLINFETVKRIRVNKGWNWVLSTISVIGLVVTYFMFGRPGFFGDKIFIIMKQQTDLSAIKKIEDVSNRREAVYTTLTATADESQGDIRSMLDKWHLKYTPYYLVNGLEAESNPLTTWLIGKRADVAEVLENPELRPLPEAEPLLNSSPAEKPDGIPWNLSMIGVDKVQTDLGILGDGIVIGQTDSGVDGNNEQLSGSYRGASGSDDYNWFDPWNGSAFPTDTGGHSTATLGIMVGKDIGIAPEAQWIGCANLARNLGNPAYYLDCMQFMLAPYPQGGDAFTDGDPTQGAMIINNSWGCPKVEGCSADTFSSAVEALETAGIFVSAAAGNTGYYGCSTVTDPLAIYDEVFTTGSVAMDGNVSIFSSIGPVSVDGSGRIKPDILAPGEDIVLAFPGNQYMLASGTSFAAPHVSGVVALMWSANPALIGNIRLTREILEETAKPYSGAVPECASTDSVPNDVAGYGIIDAYTAVEKALSLN
jgi:subtilisin family serine protease